MCTAPKAFAFRTPAALFSWHSHSLYLQYFICSCLEPSRLLLVVFLALVWFSARGLKVYWLGKLQSKACYAHWDFEVCRCSVCTQRVQCRCNRSYFPSKTCGVYTYISQKSELRPYAIGVMATGEKTISEKEKRKDISWSPPLLIACFYSRQAVVKRKVKVASR